MDWDIFTVIAVIVKKYNCFLLQLINYYNFKGWHSLRKYFSNLLLWKQTTPSTDHKQCNTDTKKTVVRYLRLYYINSIYFIFATILRKLATQWISFQQYILVLVLQILISNSSIFEFKFMSKNKMDVFKIVPIYIGTNSNDVIFSYSRIFNSLLSNLQFKICIQSEYK